MLKQDSLEAAAGNDWKAGDAFPHDGEVNNVNTGAATHVQWGPGVEGEEVSFHEERWRC